MHSEAGVVVAMTVFDFHIVTNLEADPISVVFPCGHIANRVAIAVLQEDAATIIAVQIRIVFSISIKREILDHHVPRVFTGQQRKQRRHRWLAGKP